MASKWDLRSGTNDMVRASDQVQRYTVERAVEPSLSIVSVPEMKNYLKMDSDETDDDLVSDILKVATDIFEGESGGYCICQQTINQKQKGGCREIKLMRTPVIGVPTVSYYEDFDTVTAVNITYSTHFRVVGDRLINVDGYWDSGRDGDGYDVTYMVGRYTSSTYTNADPVIKMAIFRIGAWLYENREEFVKGISEGGYSVQYGDLPVGLKMMCRRFNTGRDII